MAIGTESPQKFSLFFLVFFLSQRMEVLLPGPVMAGDILHASAKNKGIEGLLQLEPMWERETPRVVQQETSFRHILQGGIIPSIRLLSPRVGGGVTGAGSNPRNLGSKGEKIWRDS